MADELAFLREQNERFDESSFVADARLASGWRLMSDYFNTTIGPMVEVDEPNHGLRADLKVVDKEGKVLHVIVDGEFVVKDGELVNGEVQTNHRRGKGSSREALARDGQILTEAFPLRSNTSTYEGLEWSRFATINLGEAHAQSPRGRLSSTHFI